MRNLSKVWVLKECKVHMGSPLKFVRNVSLKKNRKPKIKVLKQNKFIHIILCKPLKHIFFWGLKYFFIFKDDFSKRMWIFLK
jgi:hypothetical protein